jgi:hypothetical protein
LKKLPQIAPKTAATTSAAGEARIAEAASDKAALGHVRSMLRCRAV